MIVLCDLPVHYYALCAIQQYAFHYNARFVMLRMSIITRLQSTILRPSCFIRLTIWYHYVFNSLIVLFFFIYT